MTELEQGLHEFNRGEYWLAHEAWEGVWKTLDGLEKTYLQALIQACGAFHHLKNNRVGPTKTLSKSAHDKLKAVESEQGICNIVPRVEIPGLKEKLFDI